MATDPKLSQSTAIAKATATDNRLSSIIPAIATEESPVRVYTPGVSSELDSYFSGLFEGTWTCPDGVTSVQVEAWGAGGGGGGGSVDPTGWPQLMATSAPSSTGSVTIPIPTAMKTNGVDTGAIEIVVAVPNATSQTISILDSKGNTYTPGIAEQSASNGVVTFLCSSPKALVVGDTITVNDSLASAFLVLVYWIPTATSNGGWSGNALTSATLTVPYGTVAGHTNLNLVTISGPSATITAPGSWSLIASTSNGSSISTWVFAQLIDVSNIGTGGTFTTTASASNPYVLTSTVYAVDAPAQQYSGGGGGGGGEYACEPDYPVVPGEVYSYYAGVYGGIAPKGVNGGDGQDTYFDLRGAGLEGGVVAHGGKGGLANGTGGAPGTGSSNSISFDGGPGGSTLSGVNSDNPATVLGSNPLLWWDFDSSTVADISGNSYNGTVNTAPGGIMKPVTDPTKPVQIPDISSGADNTVWQFAQGGSATIPGSIGTSWAGIQTSTLTLSCWIKGNGGANWGQTNRSVLAQTMDITGFVDNNSTPTSVHGFALFLDWTNNNALTFVAKSSASSTAYSRGVLVMGTNPSTALMHPQDGKWHHIVVTFSVANNQILTYVDGVLRMTNTLNPATTNIGVGNLGFTVGANWKTGWQGFQGSMSNVWVHRSVASGTNVASLYGLSSSTGGSGGGASGGAAGFGNAGSSSIGSAAGAGGTGAIPPSGSTYTSPSSEAGGAGGAAGNSGNSPVTVQQQGGGGGGGSGAVVSAQQAGSITVKAARSASYVGADTDGGNPGALYSISDNPADTSDSAQGITYNSSLCYSGGQSASPALGTMSSVVQFPVQANQVVDDGVHRLTNVLPYKASLTLVVNTTNAAIIPWALVTPNSLPDSIDFSANPTPTFTYQDSGFIMVPAGDAGRSVTVDMLDQVGATEFLSSMELAGGVAFAFGQVFDYLPTGYTSRVDQYYNEPASEDWYCEFYGAGTADTVNDMSLTIDYTYTSANITSETGDSGRIIVSYLDSQGTPVTTILPTAATDDKGNVLGAGVTTDSLQTWQPGVTPKVLETWHNVTSWSNNWGTSSSQVARYKRLPGNMVWLVFESQNSSQIAGTSTLFTLPVNYRPAAQSSCTCRVYSNDTTSANNEVVNCGLVIGTDGTVQARNLPSKTNYCSANVIIPMD